MKFQSERGDGCGHWPEGVRRNEDLGGWSRIRLDLDRLLRSHTLLSVCSIRKLAEDIGVSDRSVRRWLNGEHRPNPDDQERVERWIEDIKQRNGWR